MRKPNKYSTYCCDCKHWTPEGKGWLCGCDKITKKWIIRCNDCLQKTEKERQEKEYNENLARMKAAAANLDRKAAEEAARKARQAKEQEETRRRMEDYFRMLQPDYLEVLELKPPATTEMVKKRYRELAMKHHPDCGGDPAKFIKIKAAYDTAMKYCKAA